MMVRRSVTLISLWLASWVCLPGCTVPSERKPDGVGGLAVTGGRPGSGGVTVTGGTVGDADGGAESASDGGSNHGGEVHATGGGVGSGGRRGTGGTGGMGTGEKDDGIILLGVRFMGRVEAQDPSRPRFSWSGTGFIARFDGTGLRATLSNEDAYYFRVVVDGGAPKTITSQKGQGALSLASGLTQGEHTVVVSRETEGQYGATELVSVDVEEGKLLDPPSLPDRLIEIVGDSISCGYGDLGPDQYCPFSYETESHFDSYGAVAARSLGAELSTIAISGHGVIRNYDGAMTDLLPVAYQRTITMVPSRAWNFEREPDVIVINLGTNDFAKGDPGLAFEDEYFRFLADLRDQHPDAFLLGTLGPMLQGANLDQARIYIQSALESMTDLGDQNIGFLEYSTQGTGELGCDWHPNTQKHAGMASDLSAALHERLGW